MSKLQINVVFAGHVDHGKSTVIGRLLADAEVLPHGKLELIREYCRKNSRPFEYAYLIDALKDEHVQGLTITSARCFFKYRNRKYLIIDCPGHIEFVKNMVTGASQADVAYLVVDAEEGVQENTQRHAYFLSVFGIKQICLIINKMDLVKFDKKIYSNIKHELLKVFHKFNINSSIFIPVSALGGDNIVKKSKNMRWYSGPTLFESLKAIKPVSPFNKMPFRMPVQGVYKFTKYGDSRRIVAGTILTGNIKEKDSIVFYPSGKKTQVLKIQSFKENKIKKVSAGTATGFTLVDHLYIKRGEIIAKIDEKPPVIGRRLLVAVFWLRKTPLNKHKTYIFKLCTSKVLCKVEKFIKIFDSATLTPVEGEEVKFLQAAECILDLDEAIACDCAEANPETSRFVLIDDYDIAGGGKILKVLKDKIASYRDKVLLRNLHWAKSEISLYQRIEKYKQRPALILITGRKDSGKKPLARKLEKSLFKMGTFVYYLGIGSVLYGVDADIKGIKDEALHFEHIRRFAEVCNILLEAGLIVVATAIELTSDDIQVIENVVNKEFLHIVWLGKKLTTDIEPKILLKNANNKEKNVLKLVEYLKIQNVLLEDE